MIIIPAVIALQLISEVLKRIEGVCCIKTLIIFSVTSFNLAVMSWSKWTNQLMSYTMLCKVCLKKCRFIRAYACSESFGKLLPIICLNTFNRIGKSFYQML